MHTKVSHSRYELHPGKVPRNTFHGGKFHRGCISNLFYPDKLFSPGCNLKDVFEKKWKWPGIPGRKSKTIKEVLWMVDMIFDDFIRLCLGPSIVCGFNVPSTRSIFGLTLFLLSRSPLSLSCPFHMTYDRLLRGSRVDIKLQYKVSKSM